jgi:hypothetical protein
MHAPAVSKPPSRLLAGAAAAGPIVFALLLAIIDATKSGWLADAGQGVLRHSPMSVNSHGPHGWLMIVNFVLFGLLTLALAAVLRRSLPAGRARTTAVVSVCLLAAGLLLAGFRCDTELFGKQPPTTWNGDLHFLGFGLMLSTQPLIALSLWRAFRQLDGWQEIGRAFAVAAAAGIPIYVLFAVTQPNWSWWYAWFAAFQLLPLQVVAFRLFAPALRKRSRARAAAVATVVLALALTAASVAAAGTATTLRLVEHETFSHKLKDGQTFGGIVYDLKHRKVGTDRITCTSTGCTALERLEGGTLRGSFAHGGPRFTVRLTGGTGIYAGARGTVTVVAAPGTNHYTVHLRPTS